MTDETEGIYAEVARRRRFEEQEFYETFRRLGLSEVEAKIAVAGRATADDSKDFIKMMESYADPDQALVEAFKRLGLDDAAARVAARGRD